MSLFTIKMIVRIVAISLKVWSCKVHAQIIIVNKDSSISGIAPRQIDNEDSE